MSVQDFLFCGGGSVGTGVVVTLKVGKVLREIADFSRAWWRSPRLLEMPAAVAVAVVAAAVVALKEGNRTTLSWLSLL
jgi:hypothetical protein